MPEWLPKFLGSINIFPALQRHFLSILLFLSILGLLVLVLPLSFFQSLHIDDLRQTYIELIGTITFVSTVGFVFVLIYKGYKYCQSILANKKKEKGQEKLLHTLTPVEYKYLKSFVKNGTQTFTFTLYDGVVAGLIAKGILYKPDSQANKGGEQDFNLYPWAYDYLRMHPNLMQGE